MVVARGDHVAVADEALAVYERALQPKQLVIVPGGHFDAYTDRVQDHGQQGARWVRGTLVISVGDR